ncbi:BglG family transcription antiterminator [Rhodococcus qingshengii]|nr:BglG family transcription antiterminator [Rhodococcus qingshengii]
MSRCRMNNRQKELIRELLLHDEGVLHSKDLAEQLNCSEKTVRNDLDVLVDFLRDYPSANLNRKPGVGILIEIDEGERSAILRSLFSNAPKTNEERLIEMAFQLLTGDKPITLQQWADSYFVTKAAVKRDIEIITHWLQHFDLELASKQRLGNVIKGTELKKRNALAHLSELIPTFANGKNVVLDLFLPYEITTVRKALEVMQDKFGIAFSDGALESLVVHALIMMKRVRQRAPVYVHESEKKTSLKQKEYQYASWFFETLESAFRMHFPEVERIYFTWHLISGKRTEESSEQFLKYDEEFADVLKDFIGKMSKLTLFPFEADDILTNGLAVHMYSVINRIKFGFPITNPLLFNIKKMYPYMFNMVMLTLEDIKKTYHLEIPEDEAAYLVLHFQASIERLEEKRKSKKKVLIVCHMGIGMSHLLEAKIKQNYQDIDIVACIGKAEVKEFLREHPVDFIISTLHLEKINVGQIVISPLFGQEDKKKLSMFVEELKQKSRGIHAFSPFLNEDLMFFNVEKEHRYEVVEMLAAALYKNGFANKEFVHSAVNRERSSATAIGGGIAIPHGDPSMIQKTVIAAAVMKKPIEWGDERVSLVFMLAISKADQGEIRGIIGKITSLSESPLVVHALTGTIDFNDFLQVLEKS